MNRPRLRNVPRGSLLSTEVTRGKNSNQRSKIFSYRRVIEKKTEQNTFFTFQGFFVEFWLLVVLTYVEFEKIYLKMGYLVEKTYV